MFLKVIWLISVIFYPVSVSVKVFSRFLSISSLDAATLPSAIFFIIGDTCPIDAPPIKKQKNVEITVGAWYDEGNQMISCFPYQNPNEYKHKKMRFMVPKEAAAKKVYLKTFFCDLERALMNLLVSKSSETNPLIVLIPENAFILYIFTC